MRIYPLLTLSRDGLPRPGSSSAQQLSAPPALAHLPYPPARSASSGVLNTHLSSAPFRVDWNDLGDDCVCEPHANIEGHHPVIRPSLP